MPIRDPQNIAPSRRWFRSSVKAVMQPPVMCISDFLNDSLIISCRLKEYEQKGVDMMSREMALLRMEENTWALLQEIMSCVTLYFSFKNRLTGLLVLVKS